MKKSFLVLYLLFATISFASAQSMDWQYATRFGGSNKFVNQILTPLNYPHHLELDAEGNAYIFGTYGDNASFYGYLDDELQFNTPIYGDHCAGTFVAKFDCNGNVVWHKAIARETNRSHSAQYMVLKNNRLYLQGTVHMPTYECSLWFLDYNHSFIDSWCCHESEIQAELFLHYGYDGWCNHRSTCIGIFYCNGQ